MLRRRTVALGAYVVACAAWACGSSSTTGFSNQDDAGASSGSGGGSGSSSGGGSGSGSGGNEYDGSTGILSLDGGGPTPPQQGDATITVQTTIYAHTDDTLYSLDPKTNAVTMIGAFSGTSDASTDSTVTDLAVNSAGQVYVCTESVVYEANVPDGGGTVPLTKVVTINAPSGTRFYALAFTTVDALGTGTGEVLIAGDSNGNLWSIDLTSGASVNLGNFGSDPSIAGNFLALSGDIVFYADSSGTSHGLATIRSCKPNSNPSDSPTCNKTNDFLAAVDMAQLAGAYAAGTTATSLNGGIYGGSSTSTGSGIGHGEVFGLGAWEGNVYGFARYQSSGPIAPALLSIDTTPTGGAGTILPGTFSFTNGWSGAGVTTKVTITVPPPPPPPDAGPPPK